MNTAVLFGAPTRARLAWAIALATLSYLPAARATNPADTAEVAELRRQIQALREQYETRLRALEARLGASPATPPAGASSAEAVPMASGATTKPGRPDRADQFSRARPRSGDNAFNPAIGLVLSGTYAHLERDPATWRISGFPTGDAEVGPGSKSFNLGESEITFSASVDPFWWGALTVAITPENEAEVEEAFVQTTALSNGITLKAGRFFSALGYLNEQHAHTWDFVDAPLAHQAMLGGQYAQTGLQAKWVLPTTQWVELGAELGRGDAFPGTERDRNGAGSALLGAHFGGDVGASHSWRAGLSHLWTRAQGRTWADTDLAGNEVNNAFTGRSRLWVLDGVWKWAPQGNAARTHVKLQGEYFRRGERGELTYDVDATANTDAYRAAQSGWYLQGIYQFAPGWRVGLRHDQLDVGTLDFASNGANLVSPTHQPSRSSLMLDWSMSEFSRWRVQLNQDRARADARDTQVYLQYQMNLGAHGAHGF